MASIRTRANADGSLSYAVNFRMGKKQPTKTFTTFKAAEDFQVLVNQFGAEKALALLADANPKPMGITVTELYEKWIADRKGDLTPNIYEGYVRDFRIWIKPRLGHREAAMVDEIAIQDWVDWLKVKPSETTGKPLSPKSIADKHAIVHQIFAWGSRKTRRLVEHNPCKETVLPKRKKTQPKGLRLAEFYAMLEAGERTDENGEKVDQDTADLVAFLAGTSWRISEGIALLVSAVEEQWDADPETGEQFLRIFVSMERVWRKRVGFVEDAKSEASLRRLELLGPAVDVVHRRIQGKTPTDFVFTFKDGRPGIKSPAVKPWNDNSFRSIRWKRLVSAAGLEARKPTPHWLRHTHVAICILAGLSLPEIQARLGHEDIQTTINVYGRMMAEMNSDARAKLKKLLTHPSARGEIVQGEVVRNQIG